MTKSLTDLILKNNINSETKVQNLKDKVDSNYKKIKDEMGKTENINIA